MPATRYWLVKSEPATYSIDHLKRDGATEWDGVRNYQARNFMRDDMRIGDLVLFYHSNAEPPGVAGIARVCTAAHADVSALNRRSKYYDPKATKQDPMWFLVDLEFVEKFDAVVSLQTLKESTGLEGMAVLKKGQRLSVQPVEPSHFMIVRRLGRRKKRSG